MLGELFPVNAFCILSNKPFPSSYSTSFADSLGPESQEAKDCDHFLRILLDCAKTGEKLPPAADVLYKKHFSCRPHYLESSKGKTLKVKCIQSQSVVGVLYNMITSCLGELNSADEWKLDKQMLLLCGLHTSDGVDKWAKEIKAWEGLCKDYRRRMSEMMKISNEQEKKLKIDNMVTEYIIKFDEAAETLATEFRRPNSRCSNGDELLASRRCLACIVYYVTYKCHYYNEFCWNLCANELHSIKDEAMKVAEGLSPLATRLPSTEPYMW